MKAKPQRSKYSGFNETSGKQARDRISRDENRHPLDFGSAHEASSQLF